MAFSLAMPWNEGEEKMQHLLRVPELDNPTATMLTPQASFMLERGPLLALGTLDSQSRPWTTLWGGSVGFSEPLGGGLIGTRTLVDGKNDPVVQALVGSAEKGEMLQLKDGGKILSGLAIDLMTRKRVKIAGRMVAGTVKEVDVKVEGDADKKQDQIQLITKIDQSLGNCPKYLNEYSISQALVTSRVLSQGPSLSDEGRALISKSDMFFLSTSTEIDADTNHRGGPPGFVRIISSTQIIYPEYSGNRLYQSLGNLLMNPKIGVTFPDYETGNILYITGTTEILVGADAASLLPGSNLAVRISIEEARFVEAGLPFRGVRKTPSPYNPLVRTLASEGNIKAAFSAPGSERQTARLVKKEAIGESVARFTFSVSGGIDYQAGQWIALDFKEELDIGYEHMRNDDPTSLNDDFVRTFTISSFPKLQGGKEKDFEMTIRKVGPVTGYLFRQNERAGFEVPILGVGGEFTIKQDSGQGVTPFIAGGVGITPLLGQLPNVDLSSGKFKLLWTLKLADIDLAVDILQRHPALAKCTALFFTTIISSRSTDEKMGKLEAMGVQVEKRRLAKSDVEEIGADTWYLCAGKPLRKAMLSWLPGKNVVFEDFDY
ncbi:oxidoreductase-like protein [Cucurbitaria berberidis CBS 394.84]|uniref:Oxidoreductase-like protein n=1 Tax=Cucurbitaria berberidis CBS 394.84 TaxID=1168544 RepID=A0A9P4GRQ2_9PLEO|nr:oxidoreductase-like protein [Cucurbitaria berberidis CBS 394.84]KAF1850304.1 oxidoreductase-like protein [Cucurbitaria berberidis CBS 394.84]